MKKLFYFSIFALFFSIYGCEKDSDGDLNLSPDASEFLDLVNKLRASGCQCGSIQMPAVPALTWNDTLYRAAQKHSDDMVENNYFSHTGKDGSNSGIRIKREGYKWSYYCENIANGYSSNANAFEGWKGSEGHCKNMMSANVKEFGVGKRDSKFTMVLAKH